MRRGIVIATAGAALATGVYLNVHTKHSDPSYSIGGVATHTMSGDDITVHGQGAAQFTRANSEYLLGTDIPSGDISFGVACYVYLDTLVGDGGIISKDDGVDREWALYYDDAGTDVFTFEIFDGAGNSRGSVDATVVPVADTWIHLTAYHNAPANMLGISGNAEVFATAATSGVAVDTDDPIELGRFNGDTYHDGRLAVCGYWARTLSLDDARALIHGGDGLTYDGLAAGQLASLTAYWDLQETSGDRGEQGSSELTRAARTYVEASSEYHGIPDPFARGNVSFGYAAWVRSRELPGAAESDALWGQWKTVGGDSRGFLAYILVSGSANEVQWALGDGGNNNRCIVNAATHGAPVVGQWHLIYTFYDAAGGGNDCGISFDGGVIDYATKTGALGDSTASFTFGTTADVGLLADVDIGPRYRFTTLPSAGEVTILAASHVACSEVSLTTGVMSHCWDANETDGGVLVESATTGNGVNLTAVNTPGRTQGIGQLWLLDIGTVTGDTGPGG